MDTAGPMVLSGIVPDLTLTRDIRHAATAQRLMLLDRADIITTMPASLAFFCITGAYPYFQTLDFTGQSFSRRIRNIGELSA
jgi:hypothetical protein